MIEGYGLSPQQRDLWLTIKANASSEHCVEWTFAIEGTLNQSQLAEALARTVARFEILTMNFHTLPGMPFPLQAPNPDPILWLDPHRLSQTGSEPAGLLPSIEEVLDPADGPAILARLLLVGSQTLLQLKLRGLNADAASATAFLQALAQSWSEVVTSTTEEQEDPVHFLAVSEWLNGLLVEEDSEQGKLFWKDRLDTTPTSLGLENTLLKPGFSPASSPRLALDSLASLIEQTGLEPTQLLPLAWFAFLKRHLGEQNPVAAVVFDGRDNEELVDLVGPMNRYLPIRPQLDPDFDLAALAEACNADLEVAFDWQECFERARPGGTSFAFAWQSMPQPVMAAGLSFTLLNNRAYDAAFTLKLVCESRAGVLDLYLDYDRLVFGTFAIELLLARFGCFLEDLCRHPQLPLGRLNLMSSKERLHLLNQFSSDHQDPLVPAHEQFRQQVSAMPDQPAIILGDLTLSYAELHNRVLQLAALLQEAGVGRETFVAIATGRSANMIIGLLAIFEAGGIYVPMDPADPMERLTDLLDQASPALILTESGVSLPQTSTRTLYLDQLPQATSQFKPLATLPGQAAYMIFTSGSTGRPKGVLVSHLALSAQIEDVVAHHHLTEKDRFLQFSSFNFDASLEQILPSLTRGATMVLRDDSLWDPAGLAARIAGLGLSIINVPTSYWHELVDAWTNEKNRPDFSSLRLVIAGGEAMLAEYVKRWYDSDLKGIRVINAYGPTETTITATTLDLKGYQGTLKAGTAMPIGRLLGHRRAFILDPEGELVPAGLAGELFLANQGLARGYHLQPARTAQVFVPDPFSTVAGSRMYATGDHVRLTASGIFSFEGRRDHQVKLRGYRIELGEIERTMLAMEEVAEAVVELRQVSEGSRQLVAWCVPVPGQDLSPKKLRAHLNTQLPEYMVPAFFELLDAMPRTAAGKLDRKSLPEPSRRAASRDDEQPRDGVQEALAQIFKDLLNLDRVSIHDNFFEMGGHSLLATRAVSRIRQVFETEVRLQEVFANPTVETLASCVAQLRGNTLELPPLVQQDNLTHPPLSFAQERLWFLDRLDEGSTAYNAGIVLRLEGVLDRSALWGAVQHLVNRHEPLRTIYPEINGRPYQKILPAEPLEQRFVDLSGTETGPMARCREMLEADAALPYNLATGPLMRPVIYRLAANDHVLALHLHHITSDGWSLGVLIRELTHSYMALSSGQSLDESPLPIRYADFSAWQRMLLEKGYMQPHIDFWKATLGDRPTPLELPLDRARPALPQYHGQVHDFTMEAELLGTLQALAARQNVSLFMLVSAAFQLLLSRYSGQKDVIIGTPIANRNRSETEDLIGIFINTLVLRTNLAGNPDFNQLLARVRKTTLEAYDHQDLPFEKIVEVVQPERDLARNPLFQVEFNLQISTGQDLVLPGLKLSQVNMQNSSARFDLTLELTEYEGGLFCRMLYDADLFEHNTMVNLGRCFHQLLKTVTADPSQSCDSLVLMPPDMREALLQEWNRTDATIPAGDIWQRFCQLAQQYPQAIAASDATGEFSYGQLQQRAALAAANLKQRGIGAEDRVALHANRDCDYLAALLGILASGAAYMPIAPDQPRARLERMLNVARPKLLVHHPDLVPEADPLPELLDLDQLFTGNQAEAPASAVDPNRLAYVIFTSGSTGLPKGAMVTHSGLSNHLHSLVSAFEIGAGDTIIQNAPQSFDISVWQFLCGLSCGARTHILDAETVRDPLELLDSAQKARATIMQVVPSMLNAICQAIRLGQETPALEQLRLLVLIGEALPPELCRIWLHRYPHIPMVNAYGPTECADNVSHYRIQSAPAEGLTTMSIGNPILNTRLYALDPSFNPVPVNVVGRCYIGGAGVGRGYLGSPALTAGVFVPDPFSDQAGARLYDTGDLVRHRFTEHNSPAGLEFMGRADFQLKIRGFRIEPGEIETVANRFEGTGSCLVLALPDSAGNQRLVAYLVPARPDLTFDLAAFQQHLQRNLPPYMVPSATVLLERFPLNANGKLDRAALPGPEAGSIGPEETSSQQPRFKLEEELIQLWSDNLEREVPGIHHSFFDLGGNSLVGAILLYRTNEQYGVKLPLRLLFQEPTIAQQARHIQLAMIQATDPLEREQALQLLFPQVARLEDLSSDQAEQLIARLNPKLVSNSILPLSKEERQQPLVMSFAQERLFVVDRMADSGYAFNNPGASRVLGPLDEIALEKAFQTIESRHEVLRTRFTLIDGNPFQLITPAKATALQRFDFSDLSPEQAEKALRQQIEAEAVRPFDLETGPVWRTALIKLKPEEHILLFNIHHICSDGWSIDLIFRELQELYRAYALGLEPQLPELPVQYADYSAWQHQQMQGPFAESQLRFWKEDLAGAPSQINLPCDRPRPAIQTFSGAVHPLDLGAELSNQLRQTATDEGITLFMLLLGAFQLMLHELSGQDDLVTGTDVANRSRQETKHLVGFFVNQLALRTRIEGDQSLSAFLQKLRSHSLEAFDHAELPFDQVVRALGLGGNPDRHPLFQTKFFLEEVRIEKADMRLGDLKMEPLEADPGAARLDLTLGLRNSRTGISGWLNYNRDLYDPETISRFALRLEKILRELTGDRSRKVRQLCELLQEQDRLETRAAGEALLAGSLTSFRKGKRRTQQVSSNELISFGNLEPGQDLPLVLRPAGPVDLPVWLKTNRALWEQKLHKHGALLLRGFNLEETQTFENFATAVLEQILQYNSEHKTITANGAVQTPVDYAADQQLLWHNENSFNHSWPGKILFGCAIPAQSGGETPLVDSRRVYEAIDPEIRALFRARGGVMYVRNYSEGLGLSWQQIFRTESREEVARACKANHMAFEWLEGDRLRTRAIRPEALQHPVTGAWSWFNQLQHWHVACLEPQTRTAVEKLYLPEEYPRHCYFGDGSPIGDEIVAEILAAYQRLEVAFPWQKGDALIVDNLLAAHARRPYTGERKILVSMGEMQTFSQAEFSYGDKL